jgi:fatty-acid peroxygenase
MDPIPRERSLDSTFALLREGYPFIARRAATHGSDIFQARLMGRRAYCVVGLEAAEMFFTPGRFTRRGALPPTALTLLQDRGSVQLLDGIAHAERKALFLQLLGGDAVPALVQAFSTRFLARIPRWAERDTVVLHTEMEELLCRAACAWAGIPLDDAEALERTREFAAMIDGAGAVGPRNWRGQRLRARTERWARDLLLDVREGRHIVPESCAISVLARFRGRGGERMPLEVAAVELLNLLRPTVAVARFITFCVHALHEHPECAERVRLQERGFLGRFVQEARRFHPFFPSVGGRARVPFEWRGHRFEAGSWMLFDIYGTHHDARTWKDPSTFDPDRFLDSGLHAALFPQGGGDSLANHRCPGEPATLGLMKAATTILTSAMRYEVPPQDLSIDLARMPAIPASRFVIANVRPA